MKDGRYLNIIIIIVIIYLFKINIIQYDVILCYFKYYILIYK